MRSLLQNIISFAVNGRDIFTILQQNNQRLLRAALFRIQIYLQYHILHSALVCRIPLENLCSLVKDTKFSKEKFL